MASIKATKKKIKRLIYDYETVMFPLRKHNRVVLSENTISEPVHEFEIFTLYRTDIWSKSSDSTQLITENIGDLKNA